MPYHQTALSQFYKTVFHKRQQNTVKGPVKSPKNLTARKRKVNEKNIKKCKSLPDTRNSGMEDADCSIMYEQINISVTSTMTDSTKDKEIVVITSGNETVQTAEIQISKRSPTKLPTPKRKASPSISDVTPRKIQKTSPVSPQKHSPGSSSQPFTSPTKSSGYTPKKSVRNSVSRSPSLSPKKLFKEMIDRDMTAKAIEHMNLAKEGAIPQNNFDLEKIYASSAFNYQYSKINTKAADRYELNDVVMPSDIQAAQIFTVIVDVFSNPVNCGYFDESELDFIFSMLTLPMRAQRLLARMLKRKRSWHRVDNIKYPDIASDLRPVFEELVSGSFCNSDINTESVSTLLELLQVEELRKICQSLKINHHGKKENFIQRLLEFSNKTKSLFPGMKTPGTALRSSIKSTLGFCVRVENKLLNIFDRIMTLLIPNQDPEMSLSETLFMLSNAQRGEILFPEIRSDYFPIFATKEHLICYMEAKNALTDILSTIEKKDWTGVKNLGNLALKHLSVVLKNDCESLENSILPTHIRHFMPGYMWLKVLSKSIDAFKKTKDTIPQAVQILELLINQKCYMQNRKGEWYADLALIEMHHKKDFAASARITLEALADSNLSEVDRMNLVDRLTKLAKKKTGVDKDTRELIKEKLSERLNRQLSLPPVTYNTIEATLAQANVAGSKSKWCIDTNDDYQSYGSVEDLALFYYYRTGLTSGVHCEGTLPIALFFVLFWEEIYDIKIPGVRVSSYQHAPQDLYTEDFYNNRRERIDMKLQIVRSLDPETLSNMMENKFNACRHYESVMQGKLFQSNQFKEIVYCLGVEGVAGICERLINNYKLWRAGFPDLFVWNAETKEYKIVEVKGPRDTLSTKQQLWLQYLNQLGLVTEVCLVEATNDVKKRSSNQGSSA